MDFIWYKKMSFDMGNTYLSIVIPVRNDNHGGDFIKRFQNCLNSIFYLNSKYHFPIEVVIVEWNTPDYKPSISKYMNIDSKPDSCDIFYYNVPSTVHNKYKYSNRLFLYQMIAKNVGIRRSLGEFILCTNADIIFSEELFRFLSEMTLEKDKIYRAIRVDVDNKMLDFESYQDLIEYCQESVIRVNGYTSLSSKDYRKDEFLIVNLLSNIERFNLFSGKLEEKIEYFFTNACGDFQLMHKDNWEKLRGYPEFDKYSFHLDSILEYQAVYSGIKEVTLPDEKCIYHIEHDSGFVPEKKSEFEKKYPLGFRISDLELEYYRIAIKNSNQPKIFNTESWGLIDEPQILSESKFSTKIAFVAIPKDFSDEFEIIQFNSINSWLDLSVENEVYLLCDNNFKKYQFPTKVKYIKGLEYTEHNKPCLKSAFELIKNNINANYIVFVNSDIILLDNFSKVAKKIIEEIKEDFLVVGKRININIQNKIDFRDIHWWDKIFNIGKESKEDTELSIDYFFFHRNFLNDRFPKLSIGGMYWDNWLISKAFRDKLILVDVSKAITALHQNHKYKGNLTVKDIIASDMAKENFRLIGGHLNKKHLGNIKLEFCNNKFLIKGYKEVDIVNIKELHRANFKNFEDYDEQILQYISSFINNPFDVNFDIGFYLKNLPVFSYNPDALLNISIGIVLYDMREYLTLFSPFMVRAAELGYLNGDNLLGLRFKGISTVHINYWKNEIDSGNKDAKLVLALIYYYGLGCKKDEKIALEILFDYYLDNNASKIIKLLFFRLFFDADKKKYMKKYIDYFKTEIDAETFYFLGMVYCRGIGNFIEENEEKSKEYFMKAAKNGLPQGFNYLGVKFLMENKLEKSKFYFDLGAKFGDQLSIKNLKYVNKFEDANIQH
ncbi:hypothetical protein DSN97_04270 [Deferribacteraceae bacterium V6Fe1]|nr:hypothetical protein DSN97_04270 [Deferribacteraceae bacterium V6Fe1]